MTFLTMTTEHNHRVRVNFAKVRTYEKDPWGLDGGTRLVIVDGFSLAVKETCEQVDRLLGLVSVLSALTADDDSD